MDSLNAGKQKTSEEMASDLLVTIDGAIQAIKDSLETKGCEKGSLSDLIRLLQLRKELEEERPRHISVRWIDSDEC